MGRAGCASQSSYTSRRMTAALYPSLWNPLVGVPMLNLLSGSLSLGWQCPRGPIRVCRLRRGSIVTVVVSCRPGMSSLLFPSLFLLPGGVLPGCRAWRRKSLADKGGAAHRRIALQGFTGLLLRLYLLRPLILIRIITPKRKRSMPSCCDGCGRDCRGQARPHASSTRARTTR